MANQTETLRYRKGETIIREGERSDCAYIMESGTVEVYKSISNGQQQFVGILVQDDIFGELGLIDGLPRSATVKVLEHCQLQKLTQESFVSLAKNNPQALMPILKILANRLRSTLRLLERMEKRQVISETVPAGSL
jgi:CRP-like cAMP-binding protein